MGHLSLSTFPSGLFGINPSPPVFYPPTKEQRARSSSQSIDRRAHAPLPVPQSVSQLDYLAAAPSHDGKAMSLSADWTPVHGRRRSIAEADIPSPQRPARPTHRRAQSALPSSLHQLQIPTSTSDVSNLRPSPLGRLQDFSRSQLASTSAISLPTLAELEQTDTTTASPIFRPRYRPSSRASNIDPSSPPISPTTESPHISIHRHRSHSSSVPPPQPFHLRSQVSVPRPPASPRSWSVPDAVPTLARMSKPSRRLSISSTSSSHVSDIAVMATWSFPTSQDKDEERGRPRDPGKSSDRLRERLRSLTRLDTVISDSGEDKRGIGASASIPIGLGDVPKVVASHPIPWKGRQHLHHRYTHSSPVARLHPSSATPPQAHHIPFPPGPQRRPTTPRLRQPKLLRMPKHNVNPSSLSSSAFGGRADDRRRFGSSTPINELSSSPGSMVSDDGHTNPSPAFSFVSLPPENTAEGEREEEVDIPEEQSDDTTQSRWFKPKLWPTYSTSNTGSVKRRASISTLTLNPVHEVEVAQHLASLDLGLCRSQSCDTTLIGKMGSAGGSSDEEESFKDFDDI